jgi:hypothetical protein
MLARTLLLAAMLGGSGLACADGEEVPELEFFEYLGMWDETDEEWLMLNEVVTAENDARSEPHAPEADKPVEKDDES